MKRCKKCGRNCNEVYVEQDFITTVKGIQDKIDLDDMSGGWTLLDDFLNNMLTEHGEERVIGCENCID